MFICTFHLSTCHSFCFNFFSAFMDLWRWVQACPLLHLVSRRLEGGLPGFPNGLLLHDVAITRSRLRGRSEDLLFAEDPRLIQRARRGLSDSPGMYGMYGM